MNTKIQFATAATIITAAILSGCQSEEISSLTPVQSQKNIEQTQTLPTENAPAPIYSEADQTAYHGAIELKDSSLCTKITDKDYQIVCQATIQDQIISAEAVSKMDLSICDKASNKDNIDTCKMQIEVAKKKLEQTKVLEKDQQLTNEIYTTGDINRCKEVSDANIRKGCELNILTNKAIQAKDIAVCKQASTQEITKTCEEDTKISLPN